MKFQVFQQKAPKGNEQQGFAANLEMVGSVRADDAFKALEIARKWAIFRKGIKLGKFPIVSVC